MKYAVLANEIRANLSVAPDVDLTVTHYAARKNCEAFSQLQIGSLDLFFDSRDELERFARRILRLSGQVRKTRKKEPAE